MDDKQRHLKRQFLQLTQLPKDVQDVIESAPKKELTKNEKKEKQQTVLISEMGEYIKAFTFNTIPIPTVHPVPVYFDMALRQIDYLVKQKKEVINEARVNVNLYKMLSMLFCFFGASSIFASQLTNSLECLVNLLIKKDTSYNRQKDSRELIGEKILWVPLKEKIEFLIPQLTSKTDFESKFPKDLSNLKNLISYRNDCIHPRKDEEFAMDNYENLYRSCITFNYEAALESAKNFINYYYDESIIIECFCHNQNNNE